MLEEAKQLDQEMITHAPTIGSMYEGLTRDILERAIPASLDLRIVDGFIEGVNQTLIPQVDAMLVTGEGRELPYGAGHIWPIGRVIAVLEVKKNLFGADLEDAFIKLRKVMHMQDAYLRSVSGPETKIIPSFQAFARLTGLYPRGWHAANDLPDEMSYIFHALVAEQLAPVRIVIGYHGYADEFSLRKGLADYLESNLMGAGFGVTSFPNLIICRGNALLKMNGQPYGVPMNGDWWPFIASNSENPLRLLIELIWTRLANQFETDFPMDDTLQMERLAPFLSARLARDHDRVGWDYLLDPIERKQLAELETWTWEPGPIADNEWVVMMCVAKQGELDVRDVDFRRYAARVAVDPDELVAALVERRILAWCDEHTVRLIDDGTFFTGFLPDGRVVSSAEAELLTLWLNERMGDDPKATGRPTR